MIGYILRRRRQHFALRIPWHHRGHRLAERLDGIVGIFAGAEHRPRVLQIFLNPLRERVRATEHAPRDPLQILERRHGLAEIA